MPSPYWITGTVAPPAPPLHVVGWGYLSEHNLHRLESFFRRVSEDAFFRRILYTLGVKLCFPKSVRQPPNGACGHVTPFLPFLKEAIVTFFRV